MAFPCESSRLAEILCFRQVNSTAAATGVLWSSAKTSCVRGSGAYVAFNWPNPFAYAHSWQADTSHADLHGRGHTIMLVVCRP